MPSSFPPTVFTPRAVENRPGYDYDPDNLITLFAEDYHDLANEIVAIETYLDNGSILDQLVLSSDYGMILDNDLNFITFNA